MTVKTDEKHERVTEIVWVKKPVTGSMLTDPGVYVLRSNETAWDEERLWRASHDAHRFLKRCSEA